LETGNAVFRPITGTFYFVLSVFFIVIPNKTVLNLFRQIIFKNSRSSTSSDKMPLLFLSRIQKANFVMGEADG